MQNSHVTSILTILVFASWLKLEFCFCRSQNSLSKIATRRGSNKRECYQFTWVIHSIQQLQIVEVQVISVAKMKNCEEPKNAAISIIKRRGKITAFSDGAKNSDYSTGEKAAKNLTLTHCSKSSFFCLTLISGKNCRFFGVKNS